MNNTEKHYSDDIKILVMMVIYTLLACLMVLGVSLVLSEDTCRDCDIKYELCGESNGLKYYSCPQCGQGADRY